ncbi:MAG: PAS domain S-box protein, partial [Promethearchaeota archaeon]
MVVNEEQALEFYKLITENANDLIRVLNDRLEIEYINEKAHLEILGYDKEDLIGKVEGIPIDPKDYSEARRFLYKVFKVGQAKRTGRIQCKNGNWIWVEIKGKAFKDEKGNQKYLLISRDITERKIADKALKENKLLFERTVYSLHDALFILDADNPPLILDCNPAAEDIFGYRRQDILGLPTSFLHINNIAFKEFQNVLIPKIEKDGFLLDYEFKMKRKDRSVFPSEHSIIPITDENNKRIGWVSVVRDITDRKEAQIKLKESEKRYRHLFEQSPNEIILLDSNGKIIDVNSPFLDYFGYKKEDLLEFDFRSIEKFPSRNVTLYNKIFEEVLIKGVFEPIEFQAFDKNNDEKWMEIRASTIELDDTKLIQVIIQDVDKHKRTEEALISERDKLQAIIDGVTSAGLGIDIIGDDYKVNYMNKILKERFGDNIGKSCYEGYLESKEPCEDCPVIKSIKSNTVEQVEQTAVDKRNYEIFSAPIHNPDGTVNKSIELIIDITDRKIAEQKLKESEERYRHLFEQSPNKIVLIDYDGTFISVNSPFLTYFGYTREELLGKKFTEIERFSPENVIFFKMIFKKAISKGVFDPVEFRAYDQNNDEKWMELRASSIEIDDNRMIQVIIQDVDKRKRAELALKESEEKYRNIVEDQTEFIVRFLPPDGILTFVNESYCRYFQKSQEQFIGKSFLPLIVEEDRDMIKKEIESLTPENPTVSHEEKVILPNGNIAWQQWINRSIFNEEGKVIEIQSIGRDISERKKAELKLKESEENFRTITEQSLMGICIAQDNKIKYINQRYADIWGYSVEEM